jgi:hypothetical protein
LLEAVGGGDIGLARGEHVGVEERFPHADEGVGEGVRLDDRDQAELGDVAAQEAFDEGDHPGLHLAARIGEHAHGQGRLVVEQAAQAHVLGDDRVDVPGGAGCMQLAFGPFGLPACRGHLQHALGEQPHGLAEQCLTAADAAEQGHARDAELIGQALHVQAPALVDPPGGERHRARAGPAGLRTRYRDGPAWPGQVARALDHTANDSPERDQK